MAGSGMPRVLVVEDDEMVRGFLIRALERGGYAPAGVRTGVEALAAFESGPPEVVLIDGILPDMHGVRLADEILDDPANSLTAISFVTGALRDSRAADAGVGALSKPLRMRDLLDAVELLLAWRSRGGSPIGQRRAVLRSLEQMFLVGA